MQGYFPDAYSLRLHPASECVCPAGTYIRIFVAPIQAVRNAVADFLWLSDAGIKPSIRLPFEFFKLNEFPQLT